MNRAQQQKEHERLMLERRAMNRKLAREAAAAAKPQPPTRSVESPTQIEDRKRKEHLESLERRRRQREASRPDNGTPKALPPAPIEKDIEQLEHDVFTSDE